VVQDGDKKEHKKEKGKWFQRRPKTDEKDEKVEKAITDAETILLDNIEPAAMRGFNGFQRKLIYDHFEKTQEYKIKTYREDDDVVIKVYPVGKIKRLAEEKAQEVLMNRRPEALPPMGSFQRFVVHDYLKEREGIHTESFGENRDRHVEIHPTFGRGLKKAKRRLTR